MIGGVTGCDSVCVCVCVCVCVYQEIRMYVRGCDRKGVASCVSGGVTGGVSGGLMDVCIRETKPCVGQAAWQGGQWCVGGRGSSTSTYTCQTDS